MLKPDQVRDLRMAHIGNLDTISRGPDNSEVLWQWVGGALTWSAIADALQRFDEERFRDAAISMRDQLEVCYAVIERFKRIGRVGFSGLEYQRAKDACEWMDALSEVVDQPTASHCADWGERKVNELEARARQRSAA
jgi:hypothetical protein